MDLYYGREEPMDYGHYGHEHKQTQKQRSMEASKEKIYRIHGNVLNILEELESRNQKKHGRKPLPQSETDYYDHSQKDYETVDEVVQGQLVTFQAVLNACDHKVRDSVREDLEKATKGWIRVRHDQAVPRDIVDKYAEMMLEIITSGSTSHSKEFLNAKSSDYAMGREDVQMLMNASHKSKQVDKAYEDDPDRKAKIHRVRSSTKSGSVKFTFISGQEDILLAMIDDGTVFTFQVKSNPTDNPNHQWEHLADTNQYKLCQIYELPENHEVLAITEAGKIMYSDRQVKEWRPIPMESGRIALKLVIGKEIILAIDEKHEIWQLNRDCGQFKWKRFTAYSVPDDTTELGFGIDKIWAIGRDGRVLYLTDKDEWSEDERQLQTVKFRNIYPCFFNEQVWAIDNDGNVYLRESNVKSDWVKDKKGPRVESLAVIRSGVVGMDSQHDLWFRKFPNYQGNQGNWERLETAEEILSSLLDKTFI